MLSGYGYERVSAEFGVRMDLFCIGVVNTGSTWTTQPILKRKYEEMTCTVHRATIQAPLPSAG
jgi:hypothetical protein